MGSLGAGREAEPRTGAERGPTGYEPKGPRPAVSVWKVKPVLLGTDPAQTGARGGQQAGAGPSLFPHVWRGAGPERGSGGL